MSKIPEQAADAAMQALVAVADIGREAWEILAAKIESCYDSDEVVEWVGIKL